MKRLVSILFVVFALAGSLAAQQTMPFGPFNPKLPVVVGNTSTATATLTPGQMTTVHINNNAGAATLTTPTATLLCRLFPFAQGNTAGTINFAWDWYVVNNGTMTVTLAGGTGVSVTSGYTGTLTIVAGSVKHFLIVLTNCGATPAANAAALLSLGTSVF